MAETLRTEPFRSGMCIYVSRAIDLLAAGTPGDLIDRATMAEKIGRSCELGTPGYGNVQSAIRHVQKSVNGVVWRWDRDAAAWKCLDNNQRATETASSLPRIRRLAGRALTVAATVNPKELASDDRRQFELSVIRLGVAKTSSGAEFGKKLEAVAAPQSLTSEKLIALMKQS